jgi:DNA-binding MarR family transcriptional regulator
MDNKINFKEISEFVKPEVSPGFLLWQVSSAWRRKIERVLKKFDLTHPQFVVLITLGWLAQSGKQVTQKDLSHQVFIDTATISQIIRGLEKKGLVMRVRIKGDERAKYPALTDDGAQIVAKALPAVEACDKQFFSGLDNQSTFINQLQLLVQHD